jgi:hypothetical protein
VVQDSEGKPLEGVHINLFDPMLLDVTFTPVEGHIGGWDHAVVTNAEGRFVLAGLRPRPARLRLYRPDTSFLHITEPIPTDAGEAIVVVPREAFFAEVRGRVVGPTPLPEGMLVAVTYPIHVTRRGDGSMTEGSAPTQVEHDGSFVLRDVPRRHASVLVGTSASDVVVVPVESIGQDGVIEVRFAPVRALQIVGVAPGAVARVLDAGGRVLEIRVAGELAPSNEVAARGDFFPPCEVSQAARTTAISFADGRWLELPIADDGSCTARVMLPNE